MSEDKQRCDKTTVQVDINADPTTISRQVCDDDDDNTDPIPPPDPEGCSPCTLTELTDFHKLYRGRVAYVSTVGDDDTFLLGHRECPSESFLKHVDSTDFQNDDVVWISPGVYDLNKFHTSSRDDYSWVVNGKRTKYHLEQGTVLNETSNGLVIQNIAATLGYGDWNSYDTENVLETEFYLTGNGEVNGTGGNGEILFPQYHHGMISKVELERMSVSGGMWGIQTASKRSHFNIKEIDHQGNGTVYSSWDFNNFDEPYYRYFESDFIRVSNQTANTRVVRFQRDYIETAGSVDKVKIGTVIIEPTATDAQFFWHQGINNPSFVQHWHGEVEVGLVYENSSGVSPYDPYPYLSNNTKRGHIQMGGGQVSPWFDSSLTVNADTIISNRSTIALQGAQYENCDINFTVNNAVTNVLPNIVVFDPKFQGNSTVTITGNFICKGSQPNIALGLIALFDTAVLRFKDCYFRVTEAGYPNIWLYQGITVAEGAKIVFDNCTFINDGTTATITTDSATPRDLTFINCRANSLTIDPNVVEQGDAIDRSTKYV